MNIEAIKKKLDQYYATATPESVIKEFEALGVQFINTRIKRKYAWLPTRVNILNNEDQTVLVWLTPYLNEQHFVEVKKKPNHVEWAWKSAVKYLRQGEI